VKNFSRPVRLNFSTVVLLPSPAGRNWRDHDPGGISFIIHGVAANAAIRALFFGGLFLAILLRLTLMLYVSWAATHRNTRGIPGYR
jgi:hypothetical protein